MEELETQLLLFTQDMECEMNKKNQERDAALAAAQLAQQQLSLSQQQLPLSQQQLFLSHAPIEEESKKRHSEHRFEEGPGCESDRVVELAEEAMHAMERMALSHQGAYHDLNAALHELGRLAEQTQQELRESRLEVSCLLIHTRTHFLLLAQVMCVCVCACVRACV